MDLILVALLLLTQAVEPRPLDAARVAVSNPVKVLAVSSGQLHGFPVLMSWSPDGRQLVIGSVQRDRWANEKNWFHVVTLESSTIAPVDRQPDWTAPYWMLKSDLRCPGAPDLRIDVETRVERVSATYAGSGGDLSQNAGDPYGAGFTLGPQGQAIMKSAMQSQQVATTTMKLKGVLVGEFVNTPAIPGLMYSWAPLGFSAIAYANEKRTLVILDAGGHRYQARGTKGVLLPAWSPDGKRLAWLEQQGRRNFVVTVADVTMR